MLKYILKRIVMMIPVLIGISFLIFTIMEFSDGDPAAIILGESAPIEAKEQLREELGLNDPFLVRYVNYIKDAVQGDFGNSYTTGLSVGEEIATRFPVTLSLALISIFIAVVIGIPVGILSAMKRYSIFDNVGMVVALGFIAMPSFWLGLILVLVFAIYMPVLPASGVATVSCYILPSITLSANSLAMIVRMTRSTMIEVIEQDYIRTARAKGATEARILIRHALKNSLIPVITVIGTNLGSMLGGAVLVESVFAMPGLGTYLVTAIRTKNIPVVMGATMFIAVCFSIINLLVDLAYSLVDPRIKTR